MVGDARGEELLGELVDESLAASDGQMLASNARRPESDGGRVKKKMKRK